MEREELKEKLRGVDLFHGLADEHLDQVADVAEVSHHGHGTLVVRQGEPSDSFGLVVDGVLDVSLFDEVLEVDREIASLHPGDIFGDIGVLTDRPRNANIRAEGDATTVVFQREAFLQLLKDHPTITLSMAGTLAGRLDSAIRARSMPMDRLASFDLTTQVVQKLPLQVIQRHRVLPVAVEDETVTLAVVDPADLVARNSAASFLEQYDHKWVCITRADFEAFAQQRLLALFATPEIEEETPTIFYMKGEGEAAPNVESPAAKLFDKLLKTAIDWGASDIHFEPDPEGVNVRARIDGRMTELHPLLDFSLYTPLVARVKVISELNLAERRLPQDASLRVGYRRRMIDMRVSTLPTPTGESVVCRILDATRRNIDLRELIIDQRVEELVAELFQYPSGLVLVTGPTGSGKTTTLYAGMRRRLELTPTIKLITAEDPVEYELEGVSQVQVNTAVGLTFERILRSILRQDPDVLLIGEMRDDESMNIALEAALTGHLILSSLHTNSALETIMRLRQRGAENYVIASALQGIVTQRLVPRLCAACVEPAQPDERVLSRLRASGVLREDEDFELKSAPGCDHCKNLGRKGRMALYEVLLMSDELQEAIETQSSYAAFREAIPPDTFVSMRRYASHLLRKGLVDPADIMPLFPVTKVKPGAI